MDDIMVGVSMMMNKEDIYMARGVVYSRSRMSAERRLKEIADLNGAYINKTLNKIWVVTDVDYWEWVDPELESAIGIISEKALVDEKCTLRDYHYVILPGFRGKKSDMEFYE